MSPVKIRVALAEDASALAEIYSYEDVVAYTTQLPFRDARFWQDFYKLRDPEGVELVAEREGKVVGHLGMILNRTPRRKHVATFGICVHPDAQGSGVGRALMSEMLNMADNWLNIVRLELSVASTNDKAIALYEKMGFAQERMSRFDLFTRGRYVDSMHMVRFHPAWRAPADAA